jgi:hypothetical protein
MVLAALARRPARVALVTLLGWRSSSTALVLPLHHALWRWAILAPTPAAGGAPGPCWCCRQAVHPHHRAVALGACRADARRLQELLRRLAAAAGAGARAGQCAVRLLPLADDAIDLGE